MAMATSDSADAISAFEGTLIQHPAFQNAFTKVEHIYKRSCLSSKPVCLLVHGESRTGKTTVLEELTLSYPRVRREDFLEVPVLDVTTPAKPTVMGLVELLLLSLGDPRYYIGSEIQKTNRLVTLMKAAKTQVVSIDEFHHFVDRESLKVAHHVANWLKVLVDDTRVGLVVAGLTHSKTVIAQNEQLRGRFLAPVEMPRFDWNNQMSRSQFVGTLSAFHESISRFIDVPDFTSVDMAFRIYVGCGGLIGYVMKFLETLVWNAVESGSKKATLADLHTAHTTAVWEVEGKNAAPNPFTRKFSAEPNEIAINTAKSVGVESNEEPARNNRSKKSGASMNTVLRT